jgi:hypothetical protein
MIVVGSRRYIYMGSWAGDSCGENDLRVGEYAHRSIPVA